MLKLIILDIKNIEFFVSAHRNGQIRGHAEIGDGVYSNQLTVVNVFVFLERGYLAIEVLEDKHLVLVLMTDGKDQQP